MKRWGPKVGMSLEAQSRKASNGISWDFGWAILGMSENFEKNCVQALAPIAFPNERWLKNCERMSRNASPPKTLSRPSRHYLPRKILGELMFG